MVYIYIYRQKEKNERYIHTHKQYSCSPLYCFQLKKGLSSLNSFVRSFHSFAVANRKWQTKHGMSCGWQRSSWKRLDDKRPNLLHMPFVQDLRWADKILRIAWFWRLPKRWELSTYYNRPTLYTDDQKIGRIVCLHINEILWFRQRSTDAYIYIYIYIYIYVVVTF